jgi:hypothetical protein
MKCMRSSPPRGRSAFLGCCGTTMTTFGRDPVLQSRALTDETEQERGCTVTPLAFISTLRNLPHAVSITRPISRRASIGHSY